jgi:hypothetical protein
MATPSSSQILEQLMTSTDQAVSKLESRAAAALDIETEYADIQKKFDEAAATKNAHDRELRLKILEASFEDIRKDARKEEQDLAQAVFGLNAMVESMGNEYAELGSLDENEKSLVAKAEAELAEAKLARSKADKAWFFRQSAIDRTELALAKMTQGLTDAKTEARRRARQRLLQANIESNLQEFMLRVEKTIQIMQRRMTEIDNQLKAITARKLAAFETKKQAAAALEKLDSQLNDKEAELRTEEDKLATLESGTADHAAQTKKISELRAAVEELRGARNTAFVLHQSKDKFAAELEIHEKTQMKLRDNQRMWITSLRSDTEERVVTFRSRLEAMKAAADQDVAKNLDDLGAEADRRNAEYMVQVGAASDRLRMEKIEKHPKRLADIAAIAAAQAEAVQRIRVREAAAIEEFKRLYGIDPTESSFFHYQDKEKPQDSGGDGDKPAGVF